MSSLSLENIIANNEKLTEISVFNEKCLFTAFRINRNSIPPELIGRIYLYDVSDPDCKWVDPVLLANRLLIGHLGTVLSCKELLYENQLARNIFHANSQEEHNPKDEWMYMDEIGINDWLKLNLK